MQTIMLVFIRLHCNYCKKGIEYICKEKHCIVRHAEKGKRNAAIIFIMGQA